MKKNLFIVISMMMVAFLATSCGPKTPEPVLLGDGNLTAYAVLQDKTSETFLWGIRETKSGIARIKCVFTAPPKNLEEFFIGETADKKIVFDNTGKILISGSYCVIDKLAGGEKFIVSRTDGEGEKVYVVANGKTVGPKEKLFISASQIYYRQDGKLGVLSFRVWKKSTLSMERPKKMKKRRLTTSARTIPATSCMTPKANPSAK